MDPFDVIALVIAVAGLLAALANAGYLALLGSAAAKRPGTAAITQHVKGRVPVAAGTSVAGLLAVLVADGGLGVNVLAVLLAVGGGAVATRSLQATRRTFG